MELAKKEDIALETKEDKALDYAQAITMVTFYIGDFLLGIPAEKVVEINKEIEITPVPLSEEHILGIMNLRGQIVTVIDLAKKLKVNFEVTPKLNLIVKDEGEASVSFVIEEIGEILEIFPAKLEKTPDKLEGIAKEYVKNVYQLPDRLLLILDVEKIIQ
ncbi:MAG: Chemotaxis signal transduction protein CheW [Thermodesulfobacterium sp.]|uniref:Chemotaxis signal transduction protein CheW n=1 Tax=Candidatus Thermodesulfobacterium syntrophicum TaxID=3060442 RepID=A0AAE3TFJ3_9BACT|nr:Chemotaxis signal transduction protein CheW [Candidatus Thermodesulfobacterium syntrophicum]